MLMCKHDVKVSRETLRKWMMADGLWLSRRQRRSFHQPRLRREAFGELIQIDGSDHRWFENRADACTLLVFIDDATSRLVQLRFVPSESTDSYLSAVHAYVIGQVVARLRTGGIGGRAFNAVVGVGHSMGAGILQYLAGAIGVDPRRPTRG